MIGFASNSLLLLLSELLFPSFESCEFELESTELNCSLLRSLNGGGNSMMAISASLKSCGLKAKRCDADKEDVIRVNAEPN